MKITEDTDLLVGEYVLGTLEREERKRLEEIAAEEPMVAAAVMVWERRLAPLHELVAPVDPPGSVWPVIAVRLADEPQAERDRDPGFFDVFGELLRSHRAESAMRLVARLRWWRGIAIVSIVLGLTALASFVVQWMQPEPLPAAPLVSVLRSDTAAPPFIVALDLAERKLTVQSVPSGTADDRSYALWLLREGEAPLPLGRFRGREELRPDAFKRIDPGALRKSTIAVSVEPNDAPRGAPTAPFIFRGTFE
ncbi:MAG: anti-sigma factor [Bradyrhizobiaceae bacterium]|nr:anti-sigma factor [Bradyrhizobiaceae bacterium]